MIYSMTGYGSSQTILQGVAYEVAIRSVNSKQLDLSLRLPASVKDKETEVRRALLPRLFRGKVDVTVSVVGAKDAAPKNIRIDAALLKSYYDQFAESIRSAGVPLPLDLTRMVLACPGVMTEQEPLSDEEMGRLFRAIEEALDRFDQFREQEGRSLEAIFIDKANRIEALLNQVAPYEQGRIPEIRAKLQERLEQLTSIQYDAGRLEQELIYYTEKLDISEEKNRLAHHIEYFREVLRGKEPGQDPSLGKKLGFIAQEMGREINTMGSKSNNASMQQLVVRMKDELEQIKEQVLNVL